MSECECERGCVCVLSCLRVSGGAVRAAVSLQESGCVRVCARALLLFHHLWWSVSVEHVHVCDGV